MSLPSSPTPTESLLPRPESGSSPATPIRNENPTKQNVPTKSLDTTPSPSLRERRGRRPNFTNGSFRPLSVFTKSLLLPFDLDTDKALDVLKGDSPDRVEEAKHALDIDDEEAEQGSCSTGTESSSSQTATLVEGMEPVTAGRDSGMDLITALKMTSPDKDSARKITADFDTLCELPIPEASQHPSFSTNPFAMNSDAPLLFTATSIDNIRLFNYKTSQQRESNPKSGRESIERKRSFFGLELRTPASVKSKNAFSAADDSPLSAMIPTPSSIPAPRTSNNYGSLRGSSPLMEFIVPKETASSNSTSGSVRKFSDLFKKKDSMERSLGPPVWSPRNSLESPNLERYDLVSVTRISYVVTANPAQEKYLRRTTYTPTYDYDPYSPYPRHPNTARGWKSRNLKCTTCAHESCAVCHRVCCAYRAAVLADEVHKDGSPARTRANQQIQEITRLFPYGREAPTFLQCTAGSGETEAGCGKTICPDCCSICPDEMCGDTLCRKCKPAMWEECDWHKGDTIMVGSK
ncbi:hypothetical protein LTR64_005870 [Lithohypha guttulata]|uniref:uncharacterized protein n=1 Tax=Lithohypha guttulata TaxID=1690604 RepID=UPI002DE19034|nr:hypothetical protein LTR51_002335 [Lithohypha guttulata]